MTLFLLVVVVVGCLLLVVFWLVFVVCCFVVCFCVFPKEMYGFHIGATLFDYHRVSGWWEFV